LLPEHRQHLTGGALAALHRAVEVALAVLRRVLAGEVDRARDLLLGTGEARVLPDLPVGVGAERPLVVLPRVHGRAAVVGRREPRDDRLDLRQEALGELLRRQRAERRADVAARVVHQDARGTRLRAADLPAVLVAVVGVRL